MSLWPKDCPVCADLGFCNEHPRTPPASSTAAPAPVADEVTISRSLYAFLMGEGALDGTWFGDNPIPAKATGAFWWRSVLRRQAARHQPTGDDVVKAAKALIAAVRNGRLSEARHKADTLSAALSKPDAGSEG